MPDTQSHTHTVTVTQIQSHTHTGGIVETPRTYPLEEKHLRHTLTQSVPLSHRPNGLNQTLYQSKLIVDFTYLPHHSPSFKI